MKMLYRGHMIEVKREKSMAGYSMLFWSIFRVDDGWELDSGFEDSSETVRAKLKQFRERVDAEIADGETYDPTKATDADKQAWEKRQDKALCAELGIPEGSLQVEAQQ